jgi:hypothetical protein
MSPPAATKQSSACYLLHAGFFLGLFFDPEDGRGMSIRKSVEFKWTTWGYILEDRTLQVYLSFIQTVRENVGVISSNRSRALYPPMLLVSTPLSFNNKQASPTETI